MPIGKPLTKQQIKVYEFIKQTLVDRGYPPTVREIGEAVGLNSTSSVHNHLRTLEKREYLRRDPLKPRAIEILYDGFEAYKKEVINVPIVGVVTAGEPMLATENIDDVFPLSKEYLGDSDCFVLKVKGQSMINAGILDGDFVIVRSQSTAKNGEIIVALIQGEESTVKTFYKEKDHFRLQPENDYLEPIILKEVAILGKVIGVYRNYLF